MRRDLLTNRVCHSCGTDTSFDGKTQHWYSNKPTSLYLCKKCWQNYISNPIHNPINDKKQLHFRGRKLLLSTNPKKYICSKCGKQGHTLIHHIKYHEEDVLKDTIELCISCHLKEHWRLGTFKNKTYRRDPITGRFI